jgi:uncharacterized repeat protein (TIGR03803 family)
MNRMFFSLCASAVGCAFALQFPATAIAKSKVTDTVLYSFGSRGSDSALPEAGVIDVTGTLYGTGETGGSYGGGTVFSVDPNTGAETILHSFGLGSDGLYPGASLVDVKGTLYGTTYIGGSGGGGVVFSVNASTGAETVVYPFCSQQNCTDGNYPAASLIAVKRMLYGTTADGGSSNDGTVFSVDPTTGAETVVHSFAGGTDGQNCEAGLIDVKGTLYGTTESGGAYGGGTVFSVNPTTGAETVVHSFGSGTDGQIPEASLIHVKGTLYGTTENAGAYGRGTVFSVDLATGVETVLHAFGSGTDGAVPVASLTHVGGSLYYGTTQDGGSLDDGTVFSVNAKTGKEKVLHSFGKGTDGEFPQADMFDVTGTLYGTTKYGGTYGEGTVFVVTKP